MPEGIFFNGTPPALQSFKSLAIKMDIKNAQYLISSPRAELCPPPDKPEYAFIGRSNVGKSSLINMLTRNSSLAKTSGSPGKTQMINHFLLRPMPYKKESKDPAAAPVSEPSTPGNTRDFYFVDLPGYGFAKVSAKQRKSWEKMIETYLRERSNLAAVFILVDSRLEPQKLDLDFLKKLGEWGVPFNVIFTKADKSKQREVAANVRRFVDAMREDWQFIPQSFVTSAVKYRGRKEVLAYIQDLNEEFWNPDIAAAH